MASNEMLIKGATLLDPKRPLESVDIRIEGPMITEVAAGLAPRNATVIEAEGMIATPGLVNAHTHSGQNLDRGVAPNLPLDLWLIWVVYGGIPFSADDSYTLAMAGAIEMLESGCTAVLDHAWVSPDGFAEHADAIMNAYADAGIRAGLAPMIQDRDIFESMSFETLPGPPPAPFSEPLDPALLTSWMTDFFDRWQGAHPRLTPMVGPSAPQRCSDELMSAMAKLVHERNALFHTHVLETKTQISAAQARYGRSSVDFLHDLGLLGPRTSLAHCVWMDSNEFESVLRSGSTIVHNPVSNLRCGSGLLPLADLLEANVSVALGADGAASNDNQNMFEAMKFAALLHTLYGSHTRWPQANDVWELCLSGGAAALGQRTGSIEPGMTADIVLLDTHRHVGFDRDSLVASMVFAEHGESVHTVFVGGEVVVSEGRSTRVDRGDVTKRSRELQGRIHSARAARQHVYDQHVDALTAVHEHETGIPAPVERLAHITPAFDSEMKRERS